MFDHLLKVNNLMPVLRENGLSDKDVTFIKEMIYGELADLEQGEVCKKLHARYLTNMIKFIVISS